MIEGYGLGFDVHYFLSHGWRMLVGQSPRGHKESDTTVWLNWVISYNKHEYYEVGAIIILMYRWEYRYLAKLYYLSKPQSL